jgi:hypothetical protein
MLRKFDDQHESQRHTIPKEEFVIRLAQSNQRAHDPDKFGLLTTRPWT